MADESKSLPADMLLLQERRRRQAGQAPAAPAVPAAPVAPSPQSPQHEAPPRETFEDNEEDQLLDVSDVADEDSVAESETAAPGAAAIALFRPLDQVSVASLPWAGAVDHDSLQSAIVCCPIGPVRRGAGFFERTLPAVVPLTLDGVPHGEPALSVSVGADEVAALELASHRASRQAGLRLVRAAALPNSIVGAERAAAGAAAPALAAYRAAALVQAWHAALSASPSPELDRERDAAAVRLLSTLRALLGEA
jgi:hypothetical protein